MTMPVRDPSDEGVWTFQLDEATVKVYAIWSREDGLDLEFTHNGPNHGASITRRVGERAPSVWMAEPTTYDLVDCHPDSTWSDEEVLALLEPIDQAIWQLAADLTQADLLRICRAKAAADVATDAGDVEHCEDWVEHSKAWVERTQGYLQNARTRLHRTTLMAQAIDLEPAAAREVAVTLARTFTGTPVDLQHITADLTGRPVEHPTGGPSADHPAATVPEPPHDQECT